jgi:hypothetical protein
MDLNMKVEKGSFHRKFAFLTTIDICPTIESVKKIVLDLHEKCLQATSEDEFYYDGFNDWSGVLMTAFFYKINAATFNEIRNEEDMDIYKGVAVCEINIDCIEDYKKVKQSCKIKEKQDAKESLDVKENLVGEAKGLHYYILSFFKNGEDEIDVDSPDFEANRKLLLIKTEISSISREVAFAICFANWKDEQMVEEFKQTYTSVQEVSEDAVEHFPEFDDLVVRVENPNIGVYYTRDDLSKYMDEAFPKKEIKAKYTYKLEKYNFPDNGIGHFGDFLDYLEGLVDANHDFKLTNGYDYLEIHCVTSVDEPLPDVVKFFEECILKKLCEKYNRYFLVGGRPIVIGDFCFKNLNISFI